MDRTVTLDIAEIEPGWIYGSKYKKLGPSKLTYTIQKTPLNFLVSDIRYSHLKYILRTFKEDKFWEHEINRLQPGYTFEFLVCSVNQIRTTDLPKSNFEFVSAVAYSYSVALLIIIKPHHALDVDDIKDCLHQCWLNKKGTNLSKIENAVSSVIIYHTNIKKCFNAECAFKKLFEILNNASLVPIVAVVTPLDKMVRNKSEDMFANENISIFKSTISFFTSRLTGSGKGKEVKKNCPVEVKFVKNGDFDLEKYINHLAKQLENIASSYTNFEKNTNSFVSTQSCTSSSSSSSCLSKYSTSNYDPHQCTKYRSSISNEEKSLIDLKETSSLPHQDLLQKSYLKDLENTKLFEDLTNKQDYQLNNFIEPEIANFRKESMKEPFADVHTKKCHESAKIMPFKDIVNVPSNDEAKDENHLQKVSISKHKQERQESIQKPTTSKLGTHKLGNCSTKSDIHKSEISKHKVQNEGKSYSSKAQVHKKENSTSSLEVHNRPKKVTLHKMLQETQSCGVKAKLYGDKKATTDGKSENKCLFLFGEKGCGKSSLINFIGEIYLGNGISPEKYVIDILEEKGTKTITFYSFISRDENVADLTVIDTPGLSEKHLDYLINFLSSEKLTVDVHSFGFVVNSQSQGLTTNERKMFDYIRSAYGEVSNNHLITFLTYVDLSKTTPVVEDLNRYGVKPKCKLEFNLIQRCGETLNEFDKMFLKKNTKNWKKGLKAIMEMDPISVKSTRLAQENEYAKTFYETSRKGLEVEIKNFISADVSTKKEIFKKLRMLCRLTFGLQEKTDYSENKLIQFIASLFAVTCKNECKNPSQIFPFLMIMNSDFMFTMSILSVLTFYYGFFSMFSVELQSKETPLSVATLSDDNEVPLFCKQCRNIHKGQRVLGNLSNPSYLAVRCENCPCLEKVHELWTPKNSYDMAQKLLKEAEKSLRDIVDDLPDLGFKLTLKGILEAIALIHPEYIHIIQVFVNKKV